MKFIKLGSKPDDAFHVDGKETRYISSELATDIIINVGGVKFYLHKFPLLSKSFRLQKLVSDGNEKYSDEIHIPVFPGGHKAFEICVKFCYGITVTLNAYDVVAARCAAEYLEMTENVEKRNLIFKIEVFLNSSIFCSWKDSIIVLQTTKSLLPWSEDLKIVGRCIASIASKISVDPSNVTWSYTCNRRLSDPTEHVSKDWWVEDISELEIDHFRRVINAVRLKGRTDSDVIGEALRTYAKRWLPDSIDDLVFEDHVVRKRSLIETIISLLPSGTCTGCSCGFLLKLLRFSVLVGAEESLKEDLVKRIGLKLDEASANDLLIPTENGQDTKYDVGLVQRILDQYLMHEKHDSGLDDLQQFPGRRSVLTVGKLVDEYLAKIAHDQNLALSNFINLSRSIPKSARPIHDGLYKAIDIYLKEHDNLTKNERKKLCALMDVKKLTMETSMNAAQNDRLPLRVVVQVLFFEQVKASNAFTTTSVQSVPNNAPDSSQATSCNDFQKNGKGRRSMAQLMPSRSMRIFGKLLMNVGKGRGENKNSETDASYQSPSSTVQRDIKLSSHSFSRNRRHSIS